MRCVAVLAEYRNYTCAVHIVYDYTYTPTGGTEVASV